jgi:hypothetical protein
MFGPAYLKVFLGSPSDVKDGRDFAVSALRRVERKAAFTGRIKIDTFTYDDRDAPTAMPANLSPQQGITKYGGRPSEHDFTLIFLWSKMGTRLAPEKDGRVYESGTEWEYEDARRGGKDAFIYLKMPPPSSWPDEGARTNYAKLERFLGNFRNSDGSLNGFIHQYTSLAELEPMLDRHLERLIRRWLDRWYQRRLLATATLAIVAMALLISGVVLWGRNEARVGQAQASEARAKEARAREEAIPTVTLDARDCTLLPNEGRGALTTSYNTTKTGAGDRLVLLLNASDGRPFGVRDQGLDLGEIKESVVDFKLIDPGMWGSSQLVRVRADILDSSNHLRVASELTEVTCTVRR